MPKGYLRFEFLHAYSYLENILMGTICNHKCLKFLFHFNLLHHNMKKSNWDTNYN